MRRRVAVVCWESPYPTRGGLCLRIDGICRAISAKNEVSIIAINAQTQSHPRYISRIYVGPTVRHPENHQVIRWSLENLNDPLGLFADPEIIKFMKTAIAEINPDVVIVSRLLTWRIFSEAFPKRDFSTLLDLDETSNRLSKAYESVSSIGPELKIIANYHSRNINYEQEAIVSADHVLVSSHLERDACLDKVNQVKLHVIQNVVEGKNFTRTWNKQRKTVIFPGNFHYPPNRKALEFIMEKIAPSLVDFRFVIAGSGINENRMKTATNVFIKSQPKDMNDEFETADFLIAPLRFGAGTRLKVLEAMNNETVVIATRFAVEGLEVSPKIHYQPAETATQFIDELQNLSRDLEMCKQMASNAKKVVNDLYLPESIQNQLEKVILSSKQ